VLKTRLSLNIWQVCRTFKIDNNLLKTSELLFLVNQDSNNFEFITEGNKNITIPKSYQNCHLIDKIF
jgi:hypothetical protein